MLTAKEFWASREKRPDQGEKKRKIDFENEHKPLENKGMEKEGKKSKKISKKVLTKKRVRGIIYKLA